MTPERLASILEHGVCLDLETHKIQPGLLTPPLVCGSVARVVRDPATGQAGIRGMLLGKEQALAAAIEMLEDDRTVIVNLNIAFDLAIIAREAALRGRDLMPLIFGAYAAGRVYDPGIAEQLHAIAEGHLLHDPRNHQRLVDPYTGKRAGYSLAVVVDQVLGRIDAKVNDRWRESYALLENVPMETWPPEARQYPVDDVRNALEATLAQIGLIPNVGPHKWAPDLQCVRCGARRGHGHPPMCTSVFPRRNLHDLSAQCYAAWCLHLGACWGFRTDPVATEMLARAVEEERAAGLPTYLEAGFIRGEDTRGGKPGSEDGAIIRRAVAIAYGCTGRCPNSAPEGATPSPELYAVNPDACFNGKLFKKYLKKTRAPQGHGTNCPMCNGTGINLDSAQVPRTDKSKTFPFGQVQCGRDVLLESGDEFLMGYAEWIESKKIPSTYVKALRLGYYLPWTQRPNVLLDTGRASYSGVIQLLPRLVAARLAVRLKKLQPPLVGVRDCIVARGQLGELVEVPDDYVLQPGERIEYRVGDAAEEPEVDPLEGLDGAPAIDSAPEEAA